ncbi:LOW QUALITY PROTEIN: caspase recruitment domain-containing protein 6 [Ctenodactylus gundi]
MDTESSSEIVEKQKKLLKILQRNPDSVLNRLTSWNLISEEEYETLEKTADPLQKSQKLLFLVLKKGEVSCQYFLQSLISTFPESATTWGLSNEFLKHNIAPSPSTVLSKNSEDAFSYGKKISENPEITVSTNEKEYVDVEALKFFREKKTRHRETALSSRENKEASDTPKVTLPFSVKEIEYKWPANSTYLKGRQRYEVPDDSLYLGEEEYQELIQHTEDEESTVEKGDCDHPDHIAYNGEEASECAETVGFADEERSCEESEIILLEEEEKSVEERKKIFKEVLSCLNMDRSRKLQPDFVKQFFLDRGHRWTPETPEDLVWNFLVKVQALDVTARDSILRRQILNEDSKEELLTGVENLEIQDIQTINPLDILCASMLCSDSSLQREVMSNMYQCQFALPLLLPDAENNKSVLMLGAMKDIVKKHPIKSSGCPTGDTGKILSLMKMPVVSFVRLGYCSFSKSRILNILLSPIQLKSHTIFLHQDFSSCVLPRQISDGLVEITWCFPEDLKESPSFFQKPVALSNLRGNLENNWTQFGFLMEVSSAVFFFTDVLGEKEWNLLMFLGEAAIEKCYFVLSPQARESEEARIFQRILKLKSSQLLFWEEEEAGDRRKNIESLQAALQEVMSSSLRYVSIGDMASLARELGIQVDQDLENAQGMQVLSSGNMAETANGEGQQRHRQPKRSSESQTQMLVRESGAKCEVSQNLQNFNHAPVLMPNLQNSRFLPVGTNLSHVSLKAPCVTGFPLGIEQKSKWFYPFPLRNTNARSRGQSFDVQYFQPQRFYSGQRYVKFLKTGGNHLNAPFERPPRPIARRGWVCPERSQARAAVKRSPAVLSSVGHPHFLNSQLARTTGKPQPSQTCAQRTQVAEATGRFRTPTSHITDPHSQFFQPAGNMQTLVRSAPRQGAQIMAQGGALNPVFQTRSHSVSKSKLLPSSQFVSHQSIPSQIKHFQPKPFQPVLSQPKPHPRPQPSQAKPSSYKPTQPQYSQAKPSQPRPNQPKSSQSGVSQAQASSRRAGIKRLGK